MLFLSLPGTLILILGRGNFKLASFVGARFDTGQDLTGDLVVHFEKGVARMDVDASHMETVDSCFTADKS